MRYFNVAAMSVSPKTHSIEIVYPDTLQQEQTGVCPMDDMFNSRRFTV